MKENRVGKSSMAYWLMVEAITDADYSYDTLMKSATMMYNIQEAEAKCELAQKLIEMVQASKNEQEYLMKLESLQV